jgi:catalase
VSPRQSCIGVFLCLTGFPFGIAAQQRPATRHGTAQRRHPYRVSLRSVGRYQIIPVAGVAHLDAAAAAKVGRNYLFEDLPKRLAKGPVKFRLYVQLANKGDPTNDGSVVWPAARKRVELGTISIEKVAPDNEALQRSLAFNPIYLTKGIEFSDDPFPALRSAVYALSVAHRR